MKSIKSWFPNFTILHVLALVLGFLPSLFFLLFLIGDGFIEILDGKLGVIPILIMMLLTVSGYVLAWKRQKKGGMVMIAGGVIMGIYLLISGGFPGWQMALLFSLPFVLPGVLLMSPSKVHESK